MRGLLLVLLCTISFSASAQWWAVGPLKKYQRFPAIAQVKPSPLKINAAQFNTPKVSRVVIGQTMYSLTLIERSVMKTAQHQMRFREYADASYSFAELAKIYIQQNKLSEAKWFFLQSNNLSRQQNNDRLTIANLMELAQIKSTIGDFALAQQDLNEAQDMANSHNWQDDIISVKKRQDDLQRSKLAAVKTNVGLASAAPSTL